MNFKTLFHTLAAVLALAATASVQAGGTAADGAVAHGVDSDAAVAAMRARFADYGRPGAWLVRHDDGRTQAALVQVKPDDAYRPGSSIKPLVALVALEIGVLSGADEVVPWDGRAYPNFPQWERDVALNEAMASSSASYFRVLEQRIGRDTLADWIQRVDYGNGVIGEDADQALYDGTLLITPAEQLDFMDRMRRGALPFAPRHLAAVRDAMASGRVGGTAVFGKTGTMLPREDGSGGVGWFVGWTEGDGTDAAFALMVTLEAFDGRTGRLQLARHLLRDSGLARTARP